MTAFFPLHLLPARQPAVMRESKSPEFRLVRDRQTSRILNDDADMLINHCGGASLKRHDAVKFISIRNLRKTFLSTVQAHSDIFSGKTIGAGILPVRIFSD
jgi:hypothetical protein